MADPADPRSGESRPRPVEERTGYRSGTKPDSLIPSDPSTPARSLDGAEAEVFFCDLCGNPMLDRNCKLVCRVCGYQRDCSDP